MAEKKRLTVAQRHRRRRRKSGGDYEKMSLDPGDYLSDENIVYVLSYCRNRAAVGGCRAAVTLMLIESYLLTGLRAIELLGLELQDLPQFHGQGGWVRISAEFGKGKKQRNIIVNSMLITKWDEFIARFHKRAMTEINSGDKDRKARAMSAPLFINEQGRPMEYHSVYGRLKTVARNTGIDLRPHICRHTYGTQLLKNSGSLELVQDQLGHSSPATTRIYAKTVNPIAVQHLENLKLGGL